MLKALSFPIELPKKLLITFKCNSAKFPCEIDWRGRFFEIQIFLRGTDVTNWV